MHVHAQVLTHAHTACTRARMHAYPLSRTRSPAPQVAFSRLLREALNPPAEMLTLPFTTFT